MKWEGYGLNGNLLSFGDFHSPATRLELGLEDLRKKKIKAVSTYLFFFCFVHFSPQFYPVNKAKPLPLAQTILFHIRQKREERPFVGVCSVHRHWREGWIWGIDTSLWGKEGLWNASLLVSLLLIFTYPCFQDLVFLIFIQHLWLLIIIFFTGFLLSPQSWHIGIPKIHSLDLFSFLSILTPTATCPASWLKYYLFIYQWLTNLSLQPLYNLYELSFVKHTFI